MLGVNSLAMIALLCCAGLAALLLVLTTRQERREREQLLRLRQTPLYRELHSQLSALSHHDIDQVRVECTGITVSSVCPAHVLLSFRLKQNGNSIRNDAQVKLYAELLARDFPQFTNRGAYKISSYRVYRLNGKPEKAYAFTMRRSHKDFLLAERCPAQLRIL